MEFQEHALTRLDIRYNIIQNNTLWLLKLRTFFAERKSVSGETGKCAP